MSDTTAQQLLNRHFGASSANEVVTSRRQFAAHLLPNLQVAIDAETAGFQPTLQGVHQVTQYDALTISRLFVGGAQAAQIVPLQYQDVDIGAEEPFACVNSGLWLFREDERPIAILLSRYIIPGGGRFAQVEIAHLPASSAFKNDLLARLVQTGQSSKFYRGKVLSFEAGSDFSGMKSDMLVHRLPRIPRDEVILDERTLRQVDRHVFEFDAHRTDLLRLGQSIRKGILLYGPPGNGKTHLVRHICSNLPDRTTLLLTAEQVHSLPSYIALARAMQPSIVVLEDVDLIGRSREMMNSPLTEVLLNQLLNEMDGLRPDADILFILTTNRAEDIEQALALRPGRIDETIELAAPDEACRVKLVELYGRALAFEVGAVAEAAARSEGASAAFIKEFVRRLAQQSLAADHDGRVSRADVIALLEEELSERSAIGLRAAGMNAHPQPAEAR